MNALLLSLLLFSADDHEALKREALDRYEDRVAALARFAKANAKKDLEAIIANAQYQIADSRRQLADGTTTFRKAHQDNIQMQRDRIAKAQKNLAQVKAGTYEPPARSLFLMPESLSVGDLGRLPSPPELFQIMDGKNALIQCYHSEHYLMKLDATVWASGISTAGLVDGKRVRIPGVFWVSGTKTYDTSKGTNTVFVLEYIKP